MIKQDTVPISRDEYNRIEQFTNIVMTNEGKIDEKVRKTVYNVLYTTYRKIETTCLSKEERKEIRDNYNSSIDDVINGIKLIDAKRDNKELFFKTKNDIDTIKSIIVYVNSLSQNCKSC